MSENITEATCRELRHKAANTVSVRIDKLEDSFDDYKEHESKKQDNYHEKMEKKMDKVLSHVEDLKISDARQNEVIKAHMKKEELVNIIAYTVAGLILTGGIAALGFLYHRQSDISDTVIRIDTMILNQEKSLDATTKNVDSIMKTMNKWDFEPIK